jgi:serine/threonine protein kinase
MNNLIRNQSIVWPWVTRVRMALEVGQALLYLHTKGVLHRDIVRETLLLFFLFSNLGCCLCAEE